MRQPDLSTWLTEGRKGEGIWRAIRRDQLTERKKGCAFTLSLPCGPYPSRLGASRCSSARSRLAASQLM